MNINFVFCWCIFLLLACAKDPMMVDASDALLSNSKEILFYNNVPLNGMLNTHFSSGQIQSKTNYINGLKSGEEIVYFSSSSIREKRNYLKGKLNGSQKGFYENGQLSYSFTLLDGIRVGSAEEYYANGKKHIIQYYENGKKSKEKIYDVNGKVLVNYVVRDNKRYGFLGSGSCYTIYNEYKNEYEINN